MSTPSFASLLVLALGVVLGSCHFPSLKLGQVVASRIASKGHWIYMLITMVVWLVSMAFVFEATSMFDIGALSFQNRRRHVIFLVVGFLLGMYVGRFVLRQFERGPD